MGRRTAYSPGTPCWVDLTTPDVAAAEAFYGAVLGWTVHEAMPGAYSYFEHEGAIVAGLAPLSDEQRERGMPPAWSMYVSVDDVDAAAVRAGELGGAVVGPPLAVEGAGRLAAVADRQGGVVLLWEPGAFAGAELVNGVGAWSWNDLQTPDPEAAAPFYEALFGWETAAVAASDGMYRMIAHEGRRIAGIMRAGREIAQPYWSTYVGARDIDETLARSGAAGGRTLVEPMTVPAGRFAVAMDPQGAIFCLVEAEFDD